MLKVLIAEDDPVSAKVLEHTLTKAGYAVTVTSDGQAAFEAVRRESFDALLTDWMMPKMDGIELIKAMRETVTPLPLIVIITAISSSDARSHALSAGADEYLGKPVTPSEILARLAAGLSRRRQTAVQASGGRSPSGSPDTADVAYTPYTAVVVGASTGGPPALFDLFSALPQTEAAAFFIVQHGPAWMIQSLVEQLARVTTMEMHLAEDGMSTKPGGIYVAPGDRNLLIEPDTFRLQVVDTPEENFVRPSADPLFRSAAEAFGGRCIAVVLTGIGQDGASGAAAVHHAGGAVLFQKPDSAVARSMPQGIANLEIGAEPLAPELLPAAIMRHVLRLAPSVPVSVSGAAD